MKSSMPKIRPHTWGGIQNPMPKKSGNGIGNRKWINARKKIRKGMFE